MKEKYRRGTEKDGVRMESLSERNENQRIENAKKRRRRMIRISIISVSLLILFVIIFNIWSYYTKDYKGYKILESVKRTDSNSTNYTVYDNDKLMKYSRDGAVGFNEKLDMQWSGSYNFASPIFDSCGIYVGLADQGGTEVYIFNGSDSPKKIDVLYPISHIRVSSQGVLVVVMSRDSSDLVQIYNSTNGDLRILMDSIAKRAYQVAGIDLY